MHGKGLRRRECGIMIMAGNKVRWPLEIRRRRQLIDIAAMGGRMFPVDVKFSLIKHQVIGISIGTMVGRRVHDLRLIPVIVRRRTSIADRLL
jgi:hypothetical protein